jgi:hypothetical protein
MWVFQFLRGFISALFFNGGSGGTARLRPLQTTPSICISEAAAGHDFPSSEVWVAHSFFLM